MAYQHDHVLDARIQDSGFRIQGSGLEIGIQDMSFEPEEGAYATHPARFGTVSLEILICLDSIVARPLP